MIIKTASYLIGAFAIALFTSGCPDSKSPLAIDNNPTVKTQGSDNPNERPQTREENSNPTDDSNMTNSMGYFKGSASSGQISYQQKYELGSRSKDLKEPPVGGLHIRSFDLKKKNFLKQAVPDSPPDSRVRGLQGSKWIATGGELANKFTLEISFNGDSADLDMGCKFLDARLTTDFPMIATAPIKGNKIVLLHPTGMGFKATLVHPDKVSYCHLEAETPYLEIEFKDQQLILKTSDGTTFGIFERAR